MTKKIKRSDSEHAAKNKKKQIKISSLRNLKKIRENVAGIDVGAEFHYVAAPDPKHDGKIIVNRFGSFTANIQECVDWLKQCGIASAAMEATGVYWTILHAMLVSAGIEVTLVNPHDFKKIKDKKTDVCDAEYLQMYHSYGLLEGAVIPEQKVEELRTYTRTRDTTIAEVAKSAQRMQKALINMNLRLDNVLSETTGVSGMAIIHAILSGERDPKKLAQLRDKRCKKSIEEIEDSLRGHYREDHLFALKKAVREYTFHASEVRTCDEAILAKLKEFESHANHKEEDSNIFSHKGRFSKKVHKSHEFSFDLERELYRITGVHLTKLPGIGPSTALMLISETGLNMKLWESEKHFTSWLGVAPNNKVSGGRVLYRGTKRKKKKAAIRLRMAVSGLYREVNDTAIGAFFRRKRAQIGAPKAITAAANKIARRYYHMLLTGEDFEEPGAQAYYEMQKEKYLKRIRKHVSKWGYKVVKEEKSKDTPTIAA